MSSRDRDPAMPPDVASAPGAGSIARPCLAVVEDDAELREKILLPMLGAAGFEVTGLASALQLYRSWATASFDLVLREDTSQEAAFALAAHLRAQVESLPIEAAGDQPQQLSVSIGVASLPLFPDGAGWQDAVRAADRALYAAKHSGRNAWVGLWGMAAGTNVDAALADVHGALAQGAFAVGGNRPIDWSGPHGAPVASGEAGPVRAGGTSR